MEFFHDKNINNNSIKNINRNILEKNSIINNNVEDITQKYEQKYIYIINKLSSLISNFHLIIKKIISEICKISISLGNQAISSQNLLLEINKNSNEKYIQLNDRLEMINDIKKLFDNNLSILNKNLNIFISEAKKNFKELKILRNQKRIQNFRYKSVSRDKITKDYNNLINSISNESYLDEKEKNNKNNNILNSIINNNIKNNKSFANESLNNRYFNSFKNENIFN